MNGISDEFLWGTWTPGTETSPREGAGADRAGNELDRDAFLRLLMAQMQFQDPLEPVSDREFVAQLAQFSALEQMQNVAAATRQTQAFGMVGRHIEGSTFVESEGRFRDVAGRVDSVILRGGEAFLVVGDDEVELSRVSNVFEDRFQMAVWQSINSGIQNNQNLALVGQYVQALTRDEQGRVTGYVEGQVERIKFSGGIPVLVVNGTDVFPPEVISVSPTPILVGSTVTIEVFNPQTSTDDPITGLITGIEIAAGRAFLQVRCADTDTQHLAGIEHIDALTDALQAVGNSVTAHVVTGTGENAQIETVSGVVQSVLVRTGRVNVMVQTPATEDTASTIRRVLWSDVSNR